MPEKINILIVEDEFLIGSHLQGVLERLGYRVYGPVNTGKKAIEQTNQKKIDIILMDVRLAGEMNGLVTAREIMANQSIPILFMTGYSGGEIMGRIRELKPVGILVKPVQAHEVKAAIEKAIS